MSATQVSGRRARIDATLDGVAFTRTEVDALRRATDRVRQVEWDQVAGAAIEVTGKGRSVVRVQVVGAPVVADHRVDPFAVKVARGQAENARDLVQRINDEVDVRRRWREQPAEDPPA